MVWERNNIKKWRSSRTKTLVPSLELPFIRRPLSQVFNYQRGKDLFTLNVLFPQCGSFFSTLDNVFFQISSCETTKFKTTIVEIKNTLNSQHWMSERYWACPTAPPSAFFLAPFYLCSPRSSISRDHPQVARCREIAGGGR